jgi:pimeloyl-[acyl-carrier protein] methyl ester esterase
MRIDPRRRSALALIGWAMHGGLFRAAGRSPRRALYAAPRRPAGAQRVRGRTALEPVAIAAELVARVPDAVWLGWSLGGQFALPPRSTTRARARAGDGRILAALRARRSWTTASMRRYSAISPLLQQDYRATLEGSSPWRHWVRPPPATTSAASGTGVARGEPAQRALLEGLGLLDRLDLRAELPGPRCRASGSQRRDRWCRPARCRPPRHWHPARAAW